MGGRRIAALAFSLIIVMLAPQGRPAIAAGAPDELRIGIYAAPTAIDPQFHNAGPNNMVVQHFFDGLVGRDDNLRLIPALATSWTAISDTVWEFKLRPGVTFSDGSPFGAEDVVASFARAPNVPNSPSSFGQFTKAIDHIDVVDPMTVHLVTAKPQPLLPDDLTYVRIISRKFKDASTDDFNKGAAMVGTGPFKFVEYVAGDHITAERNDAYWGPKPAWKKVTIRILTADGAREAALLAGDLDLIDRVPPTDVPQLQKNPGVTVAAGPGAQVMYITMDQWNDQSPLVSDDAGKPLAKDPFKDQRVRKALSMAINRDLLVSNVYEGQGKPAGALLPEGLYGAPAGIPAEKFDADGARKLLADAGYPGGFSVTLHTPADVRAQIAQAVAQMFARVGVKTAVEAQPVGPLLGRYSKGDYSMGIITFSVSSGSSVDLLRAIMVTPTPDKGWGADNHGRYSNPALDKLFDQATQTIDPAKREDLLRQANKVVVDDVAVLPLFYPNVIWAARKGITYTPQPHNYTLAMKAVPSP